MAFVARRRDMPRAAWHDRSPVNQDRAFWELDVAPHGLTTRFTYTVPFAKKAFVELAGAQLRRQSAATSVNVADARVDMTPYAKATNTLLLAQINTNSMGDNDRIALGHSLTLLAGDVLAGKTRDLSTGGTCHYFMALKITEFSA